MTKIILNGANGKMGQVITRLVSEMDDVEIIAGVDINDSIENGYPIYKDIYDVSDNFKMVFENAGVMKDGKIEQLVLRKVELESGLLGSILNEEYLRQTHELKTKQKESDKVRKSVRENIKSVFEKLKNRKKENHFDPRLMEQLMD